MMEFPMGFSLWRLPQSMVADLIDRASWSVDGRDQYDD